MWNLFTTALSKKMPCTSDFTFTIGYGSKPCDQRSTLFSQKRPERSHSVTSAVHVFFFSRCIIHNQNVDSLTRAGTHKYAHTHIMEAAEHEHTNGKDCFCICFVEQLRGQKGGSKIKVINTVHGQG